jgi:FkbM family methyltransferase
MSLAAPYYVFRPSQIVRRLVGTKPPVTLPWGDRIECDPSEMIGDALVRNGVFELAVTELLWRLTDRGETCVDAGANIGYMTSVMARRAGPSGLVIAFEPNPEVYARLVRNARRWTTGAVIEAREVALSSVVGPGSLVIEGDFRFNNGTSHVEREGDPGNCPVRLETLDYALHAIPSVGVLKLDVEEHEMAVLHGGSHMLREGRIRDLVYEHELPYPSPVSDLLEGHGFRIFAARERFHGPVLADPSIPFPPNVVPNYLATLAPERAMSRMRLLGWRCLG